MLALQTIRPMISVDHVSRVVDPGTTDSMFRINSTLPIPGSNPHEERIIKL